MSFEEGMNAYASGNFSEALKLFKNLTVQDQCDEAYGIIGTLYHKGYGVDRNDLEAIIWYRKGAEKGERSAMVCLALALLTGDHGMTDQVEAEHWYYKLRQEGRGLEYPSPFDYLEPIPHNRLDGPIELLHLQEGIDAFKAKDYTQALEFLMPKAEQGDPGAQCIFAHMLHLGLGVEQNDEKALEWLCKAAEQSYGVASYSLATIYMLGEYGVSQNQTEAEKWYHKAKKEGFTPYSTLFHYIDSSLEELFQLRKRNAEAGDLRNQWLLGDLYQKGVGVERNGLEALQWLMRASEQGVWKASYDLAEIYLNGECEVSPNQQEAERWYRKAKQQGLFRDHLKGYFSHLD